MNNNVNDKNYIKLTPFKGWVLENFPFIESDFDCITNYQLMCKLTEYLNNVINNQNQVQELGTELVTAYNELLNYVNNYFDNLDLQEEINVKLDNMTQDGTLTRLIEYYVDPLFNQLSNNITTTINAQNTEITNIRNIVDSVASGSPLVASSTSEMTDITRVYVNTTDGKWYYYDGDSWEIGGTYQSSGIADDSIYLTKLNKHVFGNLFKMDGVKNYGQMVFQVSNTNITNVTSVQLEALVYVRESNVQPNNCTLLTRTMNAYKPSTGGSYSQQGLGLTQELKIADAKNGYVKIHIDRNDLPNVSVNAIDFRWNYNSSTNPLDIEWYVKNIRIWINGTEINNIYMTSSFEGYLAEEVDVPKDFAVSQTEYTLNNDNINDTLDSFQESINSIPPTLESFMVEYDTTPKSIKRRIACFGDSLTAGGSPGRTYPQYLSDFINNSNVNVFNMGVGGQCSGTISFRQGGNELHVVSSFNIPASNLESVELTATPSSGNSKNFSNINDGLSVSISGIDGILNIISNNSDLNTLACEFTRTTSGDTISVSQDTQIISKQNNHENDITIIWMGLNDVTFAQPYDVTGVLANYQAMVNYLSPTIKRFLIITPTTTAGMTSGTTGYNHITSINNQLKELYPNNVIDMEYYLVHDCIYDMGITPTAEDLEKMNAGTIPPSLLYDGIHPNEATREYIAKYIYENMLLKDWII